MSIGERARNRVWRGEGVGVRGGSWGLGEMKPTQNKISGRENEGKDGKVDGGRNWER